MDLIKEAENRIKEYKLLKRSLKNMDAEIIRLKWLGAPKNIKAVRVDSIRTHDSNDMLSIACAIEYCKEAIALTKIEIQRIDTNLNYISREIGKEDYGELLRLWCIGKQEENPDTGEIEYKKVTKEEICEMLRYSAESRSYFYERKKDALRKFAKAYWGVKAN